MKAVVVERPGVLCIKDIPMPQMADDEVMVKTITASICNATDNHILHGIFHGYHDYYPQILGHELFGEVVDVGNEVQDLSVGDKVVMYTPRGAFCQYSAVKAEWAIKVPKAIPDRIASLCEMFDGAYKDCVYPAQVTEDDDVLVVGQGPMGQTVAALAGLKAKTVSTVDMYSFRLEKSSEMGADFVYDRSIMTADEIVRAIRRRTNGVSLAVMCIAEDKSPSLDAFTMAVAALRPESRMTGLIVDVKDIEKNHRLDPHAVLKKNIHFRHYLNQKGGREQMAEAIGWVAEGRLRLGGLITHEVGFDGVEDALRLCGERLNEVMKVVVYPE